MLVFFILSFFTFMVSPHPYFYFYFIGQLAFCAINGSGEQR